MAKSLTKAQLQAELEQARARLAEVEAGAGRDRACLQALPEAYALHAIICDAAGRPVDYRFLDVNPAFEALTGLTRAQVVGRTGSEVWPAAEQPWVAAGGRVALAGEPARLTQFLAAQNRTLEALVYCPAPGQFAAVFHDVTEHQRLAALSDRYQLLFDHTSDAILFIRPADGRILEANAAAQTLYGYSLDELRARTVLDLRAPETRAMAPGQMEQAARQGVRFETTHLHRDGQRIPVEVSSRGAESTGQLLLLSIVRDITARQHAETERRESEEFLRLGYEAADLGIWKYDLATGAVYLDERARRHYGFAAPDTTLAEVLDRVHPDDRNRLLAEIAAATGPAGTGQFATEYRVVHPDGGVHWLAVGVRVHFAGAGPERRAVLGYGTTLDITQRHLTEAAQRESEARYRLIAANTADVIWVLDPAQGKFTYVSPSVEKLRGYTPEEVLAQPAAAALTPESAALVSASLAENLPAFLAQGAGTLSFVNEVDQPHKDGHIVHTEVTTTYVFTERGQVEIVGVTRDITERKRAERALQESRAQLDAALESMTDAVFISDAAGTFTRFNTAFATFHKFASKAECAKTLAEYPDFLEVYQDTGELAPLEQWAVPRALRGETVSNAEYSLRRKDTGVSWVGSYSFAPIRDTAGAIVGSVVVGRDITEQKRAQAALRLSEENFLRAFEANPAMLVITRLADGQFIKLNAAHTRVIGYTPAELIGRTVGEVDMYVEPGARQMILQQLQAAGRLRDYELLIRIKSGEVRNMIASMELIQFDGQACILSALLDITDRKRAEAAVQRQADLLREYAEILDDAHVLIRDVEDRIVTWNTGMERLYGWTKAEALGQVTHVLLQTRFPESLEAFEAHLQAEGHWEGELTHTRQDGGQVIVASHQRAHRDPAGRLIGILEVNNDITALKTYQETLRRRTEELEYLLDNLPAAIWIAEDPQCRVVRGNRYANALLHLAADENVSQTPAGEPAVPLRHFQAGQALAADDLPLQRAVRTGRPQSDIEIVLEGPGGDARTLLGGALPLRDAAGRVRGAIAAFHDISERKRADELLRRTLDDLRRSNAELEQFAYVASHDLQEPLRSVAGMVQLLQQRYQGQLDARADEYIQHAVEAAGRMRQLINDLLTYSRLERQGQPLTPTDANQALQGALANLAAAAEEAGATITADPLPTVVADLTQLTQLFQNLIGNALKFRGEQPPTVHIGVDSQPGVWRFWVRDNGIGLEPQYAERIFLVFQRLHTRREYPGTGIGLALCRRIVERHGGRIWVDSAPGAGATFFFTLPRLDRPAERP